MRRRILPWFAAVLLLLHAAAATAINVVVDYSYDTNSFFAPGSQARATIEAVAGYYSTILDDTFSAISTPPPFTSSLPPDQDPGTVTWQWTMTFDNPSAAGQVTIIDPTISADEYRIYVGAKSLPGTTLGQGGPGGGSRSNTVEGSFFTSDEITQLNEITKDFFSAVDTRGQSSGFSRWGGSLTFDNDAATVWHFDHTTPPVAGESDLFSVAIHELGHALGLGSSAEWNDLTSGSGDAAYFTGAAATSQYGGDVPLAYNIIGGTPVADLAHWRNGTESTVFGSQMAQEAAMDPSITQGTRKRLTALDAAALVDVGWTVLPPAGLIGDYNHNDVVDAADYTVWRNGLGSIYTADDYNLWKMHFGEASGSGSASFGSRPAPEPGSFSLVVLGVVSLYANCSIVRRRRVQ